MAVTPKLSTGHALYVDADATHTAPASATYEQVDGLVDIDTTLGAPERDTTQQISGRQQFLASLNEDSTTFRFIWDQADTQASRRTHAELLGDFVERKKLCWQIDEAPGGTGAIRRRRRAIITALDIDNILGDVITGTMTLQWCQGPSDTTVP